MVFIFGWHSYESIYLSSFFFLSCWKFGWSFLFVLIIIFRIKFHRWKRGSSLLNLLHYYSFYCWCMVVCYASKCCFLHVFEFLCLYILRSFDGHLFIYILCLFILNWLYGLFIRNISSVYFDLIIFYLNIFTNSFWICLFVILHLFPSY